MNEEYVKELNEVRHELGIDRQTLYSIIDIAVQYRYEYNQNINDEELYEIIVETMNRIDKMLDYDNDLSVIHENKPKSTKDAFESALKVLGYEEDNANKLN